MVRLLRPLLVATALCLLPALTFFTPLTAGQAPVPSGASVFKGLSYRMVGPSRGGRVPAVTGVPSQPEPFYMGVASGGVFRTTNSGRSWEPITDGQIPLGSIGAIAVADSDPNVIYVGTGSDGVRSNVSTGRGVYKSTDGGRTWAFAGLYNAGQIGAVRIHPTVDWFLQPFFLYYMLRQDPHYFGLRSRVRRYLRSKMMHVSNPGSPRRRGGR